MDLIKKIEKLLIEYLKPYLLTLTITLQFRVTRCNV